MKVCFYLNTHGLEKKDFSNPLLGNPGIGGTEFMFWTIGFYLKKIYPEVDVVVLFVASTAFTLVAKNNTKNKITHPIKICFNCFDFTLHYLLKYKKFYHWINH